MKSRKGRGPTDRYGLRTISAKDRRKLKAAVFERDGYKCVFCGFEGSEDNPLTLDHKKSVRNGGKNKKNNLQTACQECNQRKGDRNDYVSGNSERRSDRVENVSEESIRALIAHWEAR